MARMGVRWTLLVAACAGCTTSIHDRRILQAADPAGRVGYYKIEVDGKAKLAQSSFRNGLYDADALDALFGAVAQSGDDVQDVLARRRREAVDLLAAGYYRTLEQSTKAEEMDLAESRLARALRSPYAVASERDAVGNFHDRRRYALIFSAKASEIEQALAAFAEEKESSDTVMAALAAQRRGEFLRAQGEGERLRQALARLVALRNQAAKVPVPAAGAGAGPNAAFQAEVAELVNTLARMEVP